MELRAHADLLETNADQMPQTRSELADWILAQEGIPPADRIRLVRAVDATLTRQHRLWQSSKEEAIEALSASFTEKISRLRNELSARDATVSTIAQYFETLVADLTERTHRDSKTRLMTFEWYLRQLQSFLELEQRAHYCAVGLADVARFKWYNDNLGHALGDRILAQVASLLGEQIRSGDLLATDLTRPPRDLHARLGGDEFCFFIANLGGFADGAAVAERFRTAVERFDWESLDTRLAGHPVRVDVGVVCLCLGSLRDRRLNGASLSFDLIDLADALMYEAKRARLDAVRVATMVTKNGALAPAE